MVAEPIALSSFTSGLECRRRIFARKVFEDFLKYVSLNFMANRQKFGYLIRMSDIFGNMCRFNLPSLANTRVFDADSRCFESVDEKYTNYDMDIRELANQLSKPYGIEISCLVKGLFRLQTPRPAKDSLEEQRAIELSLEDVITTECARIYSSLKRSNKFPPAKARKPIFFGMGPFKFAENYNGRIFQPTIESLLAADYKDNLDDLMSVGVEVFLNHFFDNKWLLREDIAVPAAIYLFMRIATHYQVEADELRRRLVNFILGCDYFGLVLSWASDSLEIDVNLGRLLRLDKVVVRVALDRKEPKKKGEGKGKGKGIKGRSSDLEAIGFEPFQVFPWDELTGEESRLALNFQHPKNAKQPSWTEEEFANLVLAEQATSAKGKGRVNWTVFIKSLNSGLTRRGEGGQICPRRTLGTLKMYFSLSKKKKDGEDMSFYDKVLQMTKKHHLRFIRAKLNFILFGHEYRNLDSMHDDRPINPIRDYLEGCGKRHVPNLAILDVVHAMDSDYPRQVRSALPKLLVRKESEGHQVDLDEDDE
jgi:hypothetical protein